MNYRKLGQTGLEVSTIGLGTEYLVNASQETVTAVVHAAVERGINYFDVLFADPAYRDHFGKAFQGLRDKVIITGHLPVADPIDHCRQSFLDHLARLQIDFVDVVFVSCCDGEARYRAAMQRGSHYELAADFVRQGKARMIGFSTHTVPAAMQALCSDRFDVLMFPINPAFDTLPGAAGADNLGILWDAAYERKPNEELDMLLPERRQLYHECARRNIGLVAMKPFAAGWLFKPELDTGFHPINLLHYALSQPGVTCVIPGLSDCNQLEQNLAYLTAPDDQKDFSRALSRSRWNYRGSCMYCNHCQPCTAGIDISAVNRLLNLATPPHLVQVKQAYLQLKTKASDCQECGDCMQRCPFGVDVLARMKEAVALFEGPNIPVQ
jgi:predicted aldo/keto reductase-like oxidoreductase